MALKFNTSELILCFTICAHSATRHNIHMYPIYTLAIERIGSVSSDNPQGFAHSQYAPSSVWLTSQTVGKRPPYLQASDPQSKPSHPSYRADFDVSYKHVAAFFV